MKDFLPHLLNSGAARVVQQIALTGLHVFSNLDSMLKSQPLLKVFPPAQAPLYFSLHTADSVDKLSL